MKNVLWLLLFVFAAAAVWLVRHGMRKWQEHTRAGEQRLANFVAGNTTAENRALPATASGDLAPQKLLFEAAHKSGEAGEPALAIQLYGRLLARYPATAFAAEARAAVEVQKKKLPKA